MIKLFLLGLWLYFYFYTIYIIYEFHKNTRLYRRVFLAAPIWCLVGWPAFMLFGVYLYIKDWTLIAKKVIRFYIDSIKEFKDRP